MSKYIFCVNNEKYDSPCTGFWPLDERNLYPDTFPDTGVEVDEATKERYTGAAPEGKRLGADKKGNPAWLDIPPPPKEQLIKQAEAQKQYLIAEVHTETEMLRTKLALGRIKEDEKALLNAWLDYLDELEAVDVSIAPDIIWPVKPMM